jgi:hypothetical protein
MSLNIRNKSKQILRPRPRDTYVRRSKYNADPSEQFNDDNFDNYNEIYLSDDNNNSNNSDDICPLDNEDNNSNNSYPSEDNNSDNNSDYSDNIYFFEDDNNSDYSDLSKDDNNNSDSDFSEDNNNSDVEMDFSEETTNFKNITSLMMFTWITKHMIGNSAYKDLVNIINNENFNPIDVPKNIQTLKEQRKHFPLHKIRKNVVNINKEKTSSNSQPTKMAYSISIIDHIHTILNNSQIAPRLYFGPGMETDKKSEFWHGTIWQESPLFGITSIIINRSKFLFIIKLNY